MARPPKRSEPRPLRAVPGLVALEGRGLSDDELEVGSISGIFGVKGEVRLFLHNRETHLFDRSCPVVLVSPSGRRFSAELRARSGAGKRILGRITGLDQREPAETLKDFLIGVAEASLLPVDDDEFYIFQLRGVDVFIGERLIGRVVEVHSTPEVDIIEVQAGEELHFVPCLSEFVLEAGPERVELSEDALDREP